MIDKRKRRVFFKTKLLIAAAGVLILALGFNTLLITSSLEKLYVESLVSDYRVIGAEFRRRVQKAVQFGKKIEKFIGMDRLMETPLNHMVRQARGENAHDTGQQMQGAGLEIYIAVALPDGKLIYCTDPSRIGSVLPEIVRFDYSTVTGEAETSDYVKSENNYFVTLPIVNRKKEWTATAVLAFGEKTIKELVNAVWRHNLNIALTGLACSAILIFIMVNVVLPRERSKLRGLLPKRIQFLLFDSKTHEFPKRSISIGLFVIIISCQIVFSVAGISTFRGFFLKINREKTVTLNTLLKEEIEGFLAKRLPLDRLFRMEVVMGEMLAQFPETRDIVVLNPHGEPFYEANQSGVFNYTQKSPPTAADNLSAGAATEAAYRVLTDLRNNGKTAGYILSHLSKEQILSKLRDILLDTFTVLVISGLFAMELLFVIYRFLEKETGGAEGILTVHYSAIRPAAFLFLFGVDVSISFLPLHMERLYEPILGFSKDLVMGLPISVEMFFAGLSLMLAGVWIDKRGWHEPFLVGLFLAGIGILHSWLAPDAWHFIASRAVVGVGYGLSLMAAQGFIFSHTDEKSKASGIATFFAGVYSGSICGGAAGAMLAERFGYRPVFPVGAVIVFLVIGYTCYFMRGAVQRPEKSMMAEPVRSTKINLFLRFFFNRNVISLLLFNALPAAVVVVGFLNYFSPIYLNRMGASQSNIGRIFMIYGICLIFMGPFWGRFIDTSNNKKAYVTIGGVLGGMGFIAFYFFKGIFATAVTVLILGISGSFASSRIAYALKLKITQELGGGKAMGIFNASSRIGQMLGPVVFCCIIIGWGAQSGIAFVGIIYLLASMLFLLFAQSDKRDI